MPPRATTIPDEPRLTARDAANRLGVHYTTILKLLGSGTLRAVRVGKRWHTYPSWCDEYLLRNQNTSIAPPVGPTKGELNMQAEHLLAMQQLAADGITFA